MRERRDPRPICCPSRISPRPLLCPCPSPRSEQSVLQPGLGTGRKATVVGGPAGEVGAPHLLSSGGLTLLPRIHQPSSPPTAQCELEGGSTGGTSTPWSSGERGQSPSGEGACRAPPGSQDLLPLSHGQTAYSLTSCLGVSGTSMTSTLASPSSRLTESRQLSCEATSGLWLLRSPLALWPAACLSPELTGCFQQLVRVWDTCPPWPSPVSPKNQGLACRPLSCTSRSRACGAKRWGSGNSPARPHPKSPSLGSRGLDARGAGEAAGRWVADRPVSPGYASSYRC